MKSKILEVDFKKKKLMYTFEHDYEREKEMTIRLCRHLDEAHKIMTDLYGDDRQFLEWLSRQVGYMVSKIKERNPKGGR